MANEYKVGDEAELGPVRMNKFLAEVAAQGGRVELYGNLAKVVYMPEKAEEKKAAPRRKSASKAEED